MTYRRSTQNPESPDAHSADDPEDATNGPDSAPDDRPSDAPSSDNRPDVDDGLVKYLQQEGLYYEAFKTSPAAIGVITISDRRFVDVNDGFTRLFEYEREYVLGRTIDELNIEVDATEYTQYWEAARSGDVVRNVNSCVRRKDGEVRNVLASYVPVRIGNTLYVVNKLVDVTEWRNLELEVLETSAREQQRIGQDLHDDIIQRIAGANLLLHAVTREVSEEHPSVGEKLRDLRDMLGETIDRTRRLSHTLVPVELEREGFLSALSQLSGSVSDIYEVDCQVVSETPVEIEESATAMHLYRITQEAVNNAAKHAEADCILIRVKQTDDRITVCVEDDGVGTTSEDLENNHGMGMHIMQYRARLVDAQLNIDDNENGGTSVTCVVMQR